MVMRRVLTPFMVVQLHLLQPTERVDGLITNTTVEMMSDGDGGSERRVHAAAVQHGASR